MGGLLYKDFVQMDRIGKVRLTWIVLALTVIFGLIRVILPGYGENAVMATNDYGQTVNALDMTLLMFFSTFIMMFMMWINDTVGRLIDGDGKNKIQNYLYSMPIDKKTYIAAKYIFVGIMAYVFISVLYVNGILFTAFCSEGTIRDLGQQIIASIPLFMSIALFVAAIEFPMYILYGKEKCNMVITSLLLLIAFIVLGFLMFGNLSDWNGINIEGIMNFIENHVTEIAISQSFGPVTVLGLYYLSYRITFHFYKGKEV